MSMIKIINNSKTIIRFSWLSNFFLFLLLPCFVSAQKTDRKLQTAVEKAVEGFHGTVGIYIKKLGTDRAAAFNADTIFPTASMIKLTILLGIMDKIEKKELDYHGEFIYKDSLLYEGVDILGSFKDGEKIELSKLMMLMLTMSDNTASLWLQSLAGGGFRINALLDSFGFKSTRMNSRTEGRKEFQQIYGWGQTTPREIARYMEKLHAKEFFSASTSERMMRLLGRNYWDEEGLSQIPPGIFVASKNGAVDESRSQSILVMAPHGPFVLSVMTKNQVDQSWQPNNEGWELIRKITTIAWEYFEPNYKWKSLQ